MPDPLWEAEGMSHRIVLSPTGSIRGDMIMLISEMGAARMATATLNTTEQFELAKALYPAAFSGPQEPLKEEYGVMDRRGTMLREHAYLTPYLARLVGYGSDEHLMVRNVGAWREASKERDE